MSGVAAPILVSEPILKVVRLSNGSPMLCCFTKLEEEQHGCMGSNWALRESIVVTILLLN